MTPLWLCIFDRIVISGQRFFGAINLKLIDVYNKRILSGELAPDANQLKTLQALQNLTAQLEELKPRSSWAVFNLFKKEHQKPRGIYIYGGVGRGKSMLMDLFFEASTIEKKRRVHFHEFMQKIHEDLHEARKENISEAIRPVAQNIISQVKLLCFDEMQITDITDAMIVGRLFEFFFDAGVVIVSTSNRHPEELYKNGLNRSLFLPFINMITQKLDVLNLDSTTDHRQNTSSKNVSYFYPLNEVTFNRIEQLWKIISKGNTKPLVLKNKKREILIPFHTKGIARIEFNDLCKKALGPSDYILIAKTFDILMITNVPVLGKDNNNEAKRFVTLIDTLYENEIKLIVSSEAKPEELYQDGPGAFEFVRTASRLKEMQSENWGAKLPNIN